MNENIKTLITDIFITCLMALTIFIGATVGVGPTREISHTTEPAQIIEFTERGTGVNKHYYATVSTNSHRTEVEITYKNYLNYECGEIGFLLDGCFFTTAIEKECE